MKTRKEVTQRQKREDLRAELKQNIDWAGIKVSQHRPWTHVEFHTFYKRPKTESNWAGNEWILLWGVSKVCWTDKWSEQEGVAMAVDRALGWAITDLVPPIKDAGEINELVTNLGG